MPSPSHVEIPRDTQANRGVWPRFSEIPEPKMVCLHNGNASCSKPFQSFLDAHPQIYMIPAYQLMYLYPHWRDWTEELKDNWNWHAIIDRFCVKHASVLDSRKIPGHDGLATLGETQDQWLEIDETLFRDFLFHLLEDQPVSSRTFLLAVHYAYTFSRGEDLSGKKVLLYHIHVSQFVMRYLAPDFPDMLVLGMVRDPRSNIIGRFRSSISGADKDKLNPTDGAIYRRRTFYNAFWALTEGIERTVSIGPERARVIRAEDLHYRQPELMRSVAAFLGIDDHPCLQDLTFGGKAWWGDKIYDMKPMNTFNPRIVSKDWQKKIGSLDWFVLEGLFFNYLNEYDYTPDKYKRDTLFNRITLFLVMLLPAKFEREIFIDYLRPSNIKAFLNACLREGSDALPLKDYTFNAYYRHRWTNEGLNLWKPRWYIRFLGATNFKGVGRVIYVCANVARYVINIVTFPLIVMKRWRLSVSAFSRMVRKDNFLPRTLS